MRKITRFGRTMDWPELAKKASWSVAKMARLCEVSSRTLERRLFESVGKSPRVWLTQQRQEQAIGLLEEGLSVKEVAVILEYKHPQHFSRAFRKYWNNCPSQLRIK